MAEGVAPPLVLPVRFQCPLCFDVLREPIQLPCCKRHLWYVILLVALYRVCVLISVTNPVVLVWFALSGRWSSQACSVAFAAGGSWGLLARSRIRSDSLSTYECSSPDMRLCRRWTERCGSPSKSDVRFLAETPRLSISQSLFLSSWTKMDLRTSGSSRQ